MDNERVRQIASKTRQWASDNGFEMDTEDMTQYVLLRLSQQRKASVKNICIDYVRSVYGRTGSKPNKNQQDKTNEKRFYAAIDDELHGRDIEFKMNLQALDFNIFQEYLESKERAILTLRFKWGMTETEIADCFGVSEGRVSQKLTEIKEKLKDFIEQDAT